MNRRWLLPVAAVLVALLIGGVAYSESKPTDKAAAHAKLSKLESAFMERLAKELGVSPAKLRDAITSAGGATLDDSVRQGLLTPDQAAFLKGRLAGGKLELGFGLGNFKHRFGHGRFEKGQFRGLAALLTNAEARTAMVNAFAKQLGLTREGLIRAFGEGKDLEEMIEAKGLTEAKIGAAIAAAARPFVDRFVRAGKIERAEATTLLERIAQGAWLGKLLRLSAFTR